MEKIYEVTLHRVVEHETIYRVEAESEEEAENLVLTGYYNEVTEDSEEGEMQDPEVVNITRV